MESYLQVDNVDVGEDQQRVELFFPGEECMQIWNDLFVRGQAFLQLTRHLLRTREQEKRISRWNSERSGDQESKNTYVLAR